MFQRLLEALRTRNRPQEIRFSFVFDPAAVTETEGLRYRLVLGGKAIDLIRLSAASTKGATSELDVE